MIYYEVEYILIWVINCHVKTDFVKIGL